MHSGVTPQLQPPAEKAIEDIIRIVIVCMLFVTILGMVCLGLASNVIPIYAFDRSA